MSGSETVEESHLGECPICCLPLPLDIDNFSLIGSIGSDVNANAAAVVPPTPIQGNQQNGNGVAPQVDGNLLYALLSEQQRTNDEQRRTNDEQRRTNNAQMIEQRRINDRNDERFLRNDERFQAMQLTNNAQMMEQR